MELREQNEVFIEKDNDFVFSHTKIILQSSDGEYYYAKAYSRSRSIGTEIDGLEIHKIPAEDIWPVAEPKFTRAPNPLPGNAYVKRPKLVHYGENPSEPLDYSRLILDEVEVCETLRKHPHPNIAQYLGCVVEDNRVKGLGFVKYDITLSQMLKNGIPFKRSHCLNGIKAGMEHLHRLGLIHNDLNPSNIMMSGDVPVIIDFDSCKREGNKLGSKAGTDGWALDGTNYARRENDLYGFTKIRDALMVEGQTVNFS